MTAASGPDARGPPTPEKARKPPPDEAEAKKKWQSEWERLRAEARALDAEIQDGVLQRWRPTDSCSALRRQAQLCVLRAQLDDFVVAQDLWEDQLWGRARAVRRRVSALGRKAQRGALPGRLYLQARGTERELQALAAEGEEELRDTIVEEPDVFRAFEVLGRQYDAWLEEPAFCPESPRQSSGSGAAAPPDVGASFAAESPIFEFPTMYTDADADDMGYFEEPFLEEEDREIAGIRAALDELGAEERRAGGARGGWSLMAHQAFLRVFRGFNAEATPGFFARAAARLPGFTEAEIAAHAGWITAQDKREATKRRLLGQWRRRQLELEEELRSGAFDSAVLEESLQQQQRASEHEQRQRAEQRRQVAEWRRLRAAREAEQESAGAEPAASARRQRRPQSAPGGGRRAEPGVAAAASGGDGPALSLASSQRGLPRALARERSLENLRGRFERECPDQAWRLQGPPSRSRSAAALQKPTVASAAAAAAAADTASRVDAAAQTPPAKSPSAVVAEGLSAAVAFGGPARCPKTPRRSGSAPRLSGRHREATQLFLRRQEVSRENNKCPGVRWPAAPAPPPAAPGAGSQGPASTRSAARKQAAAAPRTPTQRLVLGPGNSAPGAGRKPNAEPKEGLDESLPVELRKAFAKLRSDHLHQSFMLEREQLSV